MKVQTTIAWHAPTVSRCRSGFTLIELIGVMILVGILALVALPRFYNMGVFNLRAFEDEVRAMARHAQKTAVAQRRCVQLTAVAATRTVSLSIDPNPGSCAPAAPLLDPVRNTQYALTAPSGIALGSASVLFRPSGSPDAGATLTLTGDVIRTVNIEAVTGYVR